MSCGATLLPANSVLFSSRAPIGLVAINSVPMATNQGFKSFVPHPDELDPAFLFYWLRANRAFLESLGNGATFKEVSKAIVSRVEISFPSSLLEQRRLAAMLDKAAAIRSKRKNAIDLTDELLRAAFLEMFGDPVKNPKGWPSENIGQLCDRKAGLVDGPFGSSLKPEHYVQDGVKVVRNWNIYDDHFDESSFKYVTQAKFEEVRRSEVQAGDILITTKGTVGDVCIAPDLGGPAVLSASGTVRLRLPPDGTYLPEFVVAQMTSPSFKRYLKSFEAGSAQQYLNLSAIRKLRLVKPPPKTQEHFAALRQRIRTIKATAAEASEAADILFASLAKRAFSGVAS